MICPKCNTKFSSTFCPNCGARRPVTEPLSIDGKPNKSQRRNVLGGWAFTISLITFSQSSLTSIINVSWLTIVLFALAVVLTILAFRAANARGLKKGLAITALVFCCLSGIMLLPAIILGSSYTGDATLNKPSAATTSEPTVSQAANQQQEETTMPQSNITPAFSNACSVVGIDVNKIKNWEKVDDWFNGERYSFTYENMVLKVYFNFDGTVDSINIGNTTEMKLYEQGYEPYDIADYVVDADTAFSLIPLAEEQIKSHLNYPSTANFSLLDWSYGRQKNTYYLTSNLSAENGFGVQDDISFSCAYDVSGDNATLVYLEIDAIVYINKLEALPERKAIEAPEADNSSSTSSEIRLIDGQLGEYGKKDAVYPEYINFFVPVGDYSVKNNAKISIVMIIDDKSNDEISRLTLSSGQSGDISIKSGQHIELTIYSDVSLTKQ